MEPQSEVTLTASALNVRGIRQTDSGRFPEAIASFTEALGIEPGMTGVLFNRAEAKRLSGDVAGARADILEALRLSPGDAEFIHALGLLAYEEDDFATAANLYRQALEARTDLISPKPGTTWASYISVNPSTTKHGNALKRPRASIQPWPKPGST